MKRLVMALTAALVALTLSRVSAFTTSTVFMFDGSDSTQDTSFISGISGSVTSDTAQHHTGPRAVKFGVDAGGTGAAGVMASGLLSDAGRFSFCLYVDAWPNANGPSFLQVRDNGGNNVFGLAKQATTDTLSVTIPGGTPLQGTTVFTPNTWHCVKYAYVLTSTTVWHIKMWLDGHLEVDVNSNQTLARVGAYDLRFLVQGGLGNSKSMWLDDVYVDDASDLSELETISITHKRPVSNGTTNNFTTQIGSGNSGYGSGHADEVNEQPLSQTNGWSHTGSSVTEEYTVEDAATGDVDISSGKTFLGYQGWVFAKAGGSVTGSIIAGGSSSNISLTTTPTVFTKAITSATYPAGGTDVGIITDSGGAQLVSLYEAGVMVAYYTTPVGGSFVPAIINAPIRGGGLWPDYRR